MSSFTRKVEKQMDDRGYLEIRPFLILDCYHDAGLKLVPFLFQAQANNANPALLETVYCFFSAAASAAALALFSRTPTRRASERATRRVLKAFSVAG